MPYLGVQPSKGLVGTAGIDADAITSAKIADDQIDSEHYAAGSIDTAHIAANQIDGTLTKDALIADYSDVTITASDLIMYGDATDSNNTKRDTVQGILDLAGGDNTLHVAAAGASTLARTGLTAGALYEIWGQLGLSANATVYAEFGYGGTPTYTAGAAYQVAALGINDVGTSKDYSSTSTDNIDMHADTLLGARYAMKFHGHLYASDTSDSEENPTLGLVIDCRTTTANSQNTFVLTARNGGSDYNGSNALTAIRFTVSTGNFAHGFLKLREVTQS